MNNINLTQEQITNAGMHFFDHLLEIEGTGGMRLVAMTDVLNSLWDNPSGTPFVFVTFEVARWLEDENGEIDDEVLGRTAQFFPEDFDGAMVEFEFQNLIRRGLSS